MKVTFDPENYVSSGTTSFAAWNSPYLAQVIRRLFDERPGERITEIVVTSEGIKAVFR